MVVVCVGGVEREREGYDVLFVLFGPFSKIQK